MSLWTASSRFLSLGPSVWTEEASLHLRTPFLLRVLSLGSYCHDVVVDSRRRTITFRKRFLWAFSHKRNVAFGEVDHLDYEYKGVPTGWSYLHGTTDEIDTYIVSLVLKGAGERIPVATFRGEGAVCTGWTGVLFSDDTALDLHGTQGDDSLTLVEGLRRILGVPLGKQIGPIRDVQGVLWRCTACARNSPPRRPKCQYCGAPAAPVSE